MDPKALPGSDIHSDFVKSFLASSIAIDTASPRFARLVNWLSRIVSVAALCILLQSPDRASVIERPTQSSVLGLLGTGFLLVCASFLVHAPATRGASEEQIPLAGGDDDGLLARPRSISVSAPERAPWAHLRFGLTALAIMFRLRCFESVFRNLQCRTAGVEALLPILSALFDYSPFGSPTHVHALESLPPTQRLLRSLGPATIVAWANNLLWRVASTPRSTVICPATPGTTSWVVTMQLLAVGLDAWILHSVQTLLSGLQTRSPAPAKRTPLVLGMLFMVSAGLIFATGLMTAILPQYRAVLANINRRYANNLFWETGVFATLCLFGSYWVALHTSTDLTILLSFVSSGIQAWTGWTNASESQAPHLYLPAIPPFLLLIFGTTLYLYTTRHAILFDSTFPSRYYRSFLLVLGVGIVGITIARGIFGFAGDGFHASHPIGTLMERAGKVHDDWAAQAGQSKSLQEAVDRYVKRYGRHPPPGFGKWYDFAISKKALVIDDFDAIHENLQPFWKLEPRALRIRTKYMLMDTKHDCAEVMIQNGEATIGNVIPTHRWMVEGIIHMLEPFIKELPDMLLAFNINDEPRVTLPYKILQDLDKVTVEPENTAQLKNSWPIDRASTWEIPEGEMMRPLEMRYFSFKRIWRLHGAVACPPNSPAWTSHFWDPTVTCTWCYEPHSYEHFLSNWTLAESPCHQPDLPNLHGFYLAPSAFNPTHEVLPIFSQSRAGGFHDILYPTAWNYNDKVKLDPNAEFPDDEFEKKENTLFWHGSATEGFSKAGSWRGQTRQRLVQLVNNSSMKTNVLLPDGSGYRYAGLTTPEFMAHPTMRATDFSTTIGFVNGFTRCDNGDCEAQEAAFGLFPSTDFQAHWRHRFLFDADGAGFSGRFLPFLRSHSVPLKTAIFREWYDSRLTAWKHFVPVDIRLHNLWSTVAYFAGQGFGTKGGQAAAKQIAEDGRAWANQVLRKEDMEIYFYRLLLEYARVMDDERATLGYVYK